MEQNANAELLSKDELLYWIDKDFVQETAYTKIGRNLNEEEMLRVKKLIEFGLWDAVYDTIKIAIDEVTE
ncbi:MAG TPA: hypothetical protein PKY59_17445 [Pyrinomonadaceae bacterium]|nr:hypothetical protein [Pyrinomonadaceae bacterium]